jgi:hypothetical protein
MAQSGEGDLRDSYFGDARSVAEPFALLRYCTKLKPEEAHMAKKTTAGQTDTKPPKRTRSKPAQAHSSASFRAKVRMYKQGLGDCHLIQLPRTHRSDTDYLIMIDCGVVLGTPQPQGKRAPAIADIMKTTSGRVDLLMATHEHWDHLSGFIQAREAFENFKVDEIWLAWTEDSNDDLATNLKHEKDEALSAPRLAASHLHLAASAGMRSDLESVFGIFWRE